MCGRFILDVDIQTLKQTYGIEDDPIDFIPRSEIFPSHFVPIIVNKAGKLYMENMKWGFPNPFSKGLLINARSETIEKKSMFKDSFFNRRGIVPAQGFYEWKKIGKDNVKHRIKIKEKEIFSMATIYNYYEDGQGGFYGAFVILTREALGPMKEIHHRMPLILSPHQQEIWLNADIQDKDKIKEVVENFEGTFDIQPLGHIQQSIDDLL